MAAIIPPGLQIPPGMDPREFYLQLPALGPAQIPPGADTTMTTSGPDQIWYLVVAVTCIAVPAFFLMIRIYTRLAIFKSLELVDYFLFLSFPLIVVEIAMGWYMVKWGAGVHQWQVTLEQLFNQLFWANTAQVIYCPLCFLVKMSILLQYLQLFAPSRSINRTMWYGTWCTVAATFVAYTAFTFWTLFYCSPRTMIWNKLEMGTCMDVNIILFSQGGFNILSDVVVLLLPISSLWQLNVPLAKKIFITLMFGTGLLACAASALRILFTMRIASVISEADVSHNGLFIGLWTEAEVSLGFIVACSLCLPKLIQVKGRKLRESFSWASAPFSALSSKSGKSSLWGASRKTTQTDSRLSEHKQSDEERGIYFEEQLQLQQARLQPNQPRHDIYALPSSLGSSEYTQSIYSQDSTPARDSFDDIIVEATAVARPQMSRSISVRTQEVPIRLDPTDMSPEQLQHERRILQEFDFESFRLSLNSEMWRSPA
ncbi:hypothetical protein IQ07DRAFT_634150 [Pyrenochaeta sp. DS3sAY3a]|nr:hypothetical protein IQ07DRAFT_634150 [Pyrenochaeta sp. DS3sAY3a]